MDDQHCAEAVIVRVVLLADVVEFFHNVFGSPNISAQTLNVAVSLDRRSKHSVVLV